MKYGLLLLLVSLLCYSANSQDFNLDNKAYRTISWQEFFERLNQNPGLVYFDIRTPGERSDTSQYRSYNQGKLKGAIETDFFEFGAYYPEYLKHKNDTIYLYCSHSRRSRLLAKQLADSSFANVISINGGLSYLNSLPPEEIADREKYYSSNLKYSVVSPYFFIKNTGNTDLQYIDVRPDSVYDGISADERENSFGRIDNVLHIPYDRIRDNLHLLIKDKNIILFDNYGEEAPVAAEYLASIGYNSSILLFGLDNLTGYIPAGEREILKTKYEVILPAELLEASKDTNTVIIDVRTVTEFTGTDTTEWKNAGRLKNAVNIPLTDISKDKLDLYKDKRIILYDIMMHDELYEFAEKMHGYGFRNFYLLAGGIFQLRWEIYNTEKRELLQLLAE